MAVSIDHIAIPSRDPHESAHLLGEVLGLRVVPEGPDGEFSSLQLDGRASLLFVPATGSVSPHHLALRVSSQEFAEVVRRLRARKIAFGNAPEDPTNARADDPLGGHGRVYFADPDGHFFEVCA